MTLDEILKLRAEKPDEFCCLVAEKLLGYQWDGNPRGEQRLRGRKGYVAARKGGVYRMLGYPEWDIPRVNVSADADLEVHRVACGQQTRWLFSKRQRYYAFLTNILRRRANVNVAWPDAMEYYQVGDYATAALATVLGEHQ